MKKIHEISLVLEGLSCLTHCIHGIVPILAVGVSHGKLILILLKVLMLR